MNLSEALENAKDPAPVPVPELRYLRAAANRVRERWPDVQVSMPETEREALALKLRDRVEADDWHDTRLSFVIAAASAVFDEERLDRPDLARTREFLYGETAASSSETFLSGMFRAYLESYVPQAVHTTTLADALEAARPRLSRGTRALLEAAPELLDPKSGPEQLAGRMSKMSDPYAELRSLGMRNPHGAGFMELAHLSLTAQVQPYLSERPLIDWYIRWLRPASKEEARLSGASAAIEALIYPWLDKTPEEDLRSYLVETLIDLYGDPRIKSGGVWSGISERCMAIVHRWLTREDMRFFTGVVDATQKNDMWPPRRDLWLQLYDEGKIDAAWAALSSQAFEYARRHLMRQDAKNAYTRVGYQRARQNTSLLIMKIGNKIMVDGCHSYRTHVFDIADPMAPQLFKEGYDCDEIMRASDERSPSASKSHSSIPTWKRWVRDMINADVKWSRRTRPYTEVRRPSPPGSPYPQARRPASPPPAPSPSPQNGGMAPPSDQPRLGPRGARRALVGPDTGTSAARAGAPPASVAAAKRGPRIPSTPGTDGDPTSLKETRFPNLTDRMIAYGPSAVTAVLAYLEAPADGRSRPLLSRTSRDALAWIQEEKGEPPRALRNALEHLLIGLKTSGVDLDALFASSEPDTPKEDHAPRPTAAPKRKAVTQPQHIPPLPGDAQRRLDLLRTHADAIEDLAMTKRTSEERKVLSNALRKLKERSPDLRPTEIAELQALYQELRARETGSRK